MPSTVLLVVVDEVDALVAGAFLAGAFLAGAFLAVVVVVEEAVAAVDAEDGTELPVMFDDGEAAVTEGDAVTGVELDGEALTGVLAGVVDDVVLDGLADDDEDVVGVGAGVELAGAFGV